jgi:hypothetical protein
MFEAMQMYLESCCEVLNAEAMVVLLDENRICVGIGLPPFPMSEGRAVHISHEVSHLTASLI